MPAVSKPPASCHMRRRKRPPHVSARVTASLQACSVVEATEKQDLQTEILQDCCISIKWPTGACTRGSCSLASRNRTGHMLLWVASVRRVAAETRLTRGHPHQARQRPSSVSSSTFGTCHTAPSSALEPGRSLQVQAHPHLQPVGAAWRPLPSLPAVCFANQFQGSLRRMAAPNGGTCLFIIVISHIAKTSTSYTSCFSCNDLLLPQLRMSIGSSV